MDGQQEEDNDNTNGNENTQDHSVELQPGLFDAMLEPANDFIAPAVTMDSVDDAPVRSSDASQGVSSLCIQM